MREINKPLPSDDNAERCVLGGILLDNRLMSQCVGTVNGTDFYNPLYRRIFNAMLALYERSESIDPILIANELKKDGDVENIGGISTITNLSYGLPHFTDLTEYLDIIKEKSRGRKLIQICSITADDALEESESIDSVLDVHENLIYELRKKTGAAGFRKLGEIAGETYDKIRDFSNKADNNLLGMTTGFKDLDLRTSGLEAGDLIIVAGRPSSGKTSLSLRMAYRASMAADKPVVAYMSLEMSNHQLAQRMIATEAGVDLMRLRRGHLSRDEWNKAVFVTEQFEKSNLFIDQTPGLTTMEIRSRLRQLQTEQKRLDMVVIDHLGLIGHGNDRKSRHLQVSDHTKALKNLAKDMNVPVVALCQLSRKPEERKPPKPIMSDLRDSGSIEEDADLVFFIYRHHYYYPTDTDKENEAEIICGKNRNGPTGADKLTFIRHWTRFDDYAY